MASAHVGGSWGGRFCRLETPGWPATVFGDTRLVRVSRGTAERSAGLWSSQDCAHLTVNYAKAECQKM